MVLLVILFLVSFSTLQTVVAQPTIVNTNVPQLNSRNNFWVTFDFEDLAPTCCPGALPFCGDGKCNRTENCLNCPQDCKCLYCGDGLCLRQDNETCTTCPQDCGSCASRVQCGDGVCSQNYETCANCPIDCGSCVLCGDGVCEFTENCDSCPSDCGGACPSGVLVGGAVDITTNLPITGALIQTTNVRAGNEYSILTNTAGNFYFQLLPVQIVNLQATHPDYGIARVSVQILLNQIVNITIFMAPALETNEWRIQLTWGASPQDLDLYLFSDWDSRLYRSGVVNWESRNKSAGLPFAALLTDADRGYGPERIAIYRFTTPRQNAEIWVHNYSGDRKNTSEVLRGSSARVVAWTGRLGIQVDTMVSPTLTPGNQTWWHVFDITPQQNPVLVNQYFFGNSAPCAWSYCPYRPIDLFLKKKK